MGTIAKNKQAPKQPFCGLQELSQRLKILAAKAPDRQTFDEIYSVVEELSRLDDCLVRLRYERSFVDDQDIDQALDRLRGCRQRGA